MKQTAVEWFFMQLTEVERNLINKTYLQNNNTLAGYKLKELFEQAKQMEKEQIVDSVKYGCSDWGSAKDAEQYYNGTFKSECYHPLTERKHTSDTHFECTICGYNNY